MFSKAQQKENLNLKNKAIIQGNICIQNRVR